MATSDKIIIYQLLPRLFSNLTQPVAPNGSVSQNGVGKFSGINPEVIAAIKELGASHIWLTGVIEHATATDYSDFGIRPDNPFIVKGKAGSPYAIKDYYDVDPDLADNPRTRMAEFESLVDRIHAAGMKVLIDFVPNHVARQYNSDVKPVGVDDFGVHDDQSVYFSPNNNFYYIPRQLFAPHIPLGNGHNAYIEFPAKASGNDCFTAFPGQYDWYETVKLNYGVDYGNHSHHFDPIPDTWFKMLHILRFWAAKGIDGFRCDMVHMVPLEFWRWALPQVKKSFPGIIFIGEIYEPGLYRPFLEAGFDYLYDKVNLYDTLRRIETANFSAAQLSSCWQTVEGIGPRMLNFLESHDEQRFASQFYAGNPAKVGASLAVSATFSTGPMMIYMGQELGEDAPDAEGFSGHDGRTTIFDYWSMASTRRWLAPDGKPDDDRLSPDAQRLRNFYKRLLNITASEEAITKGGFFDLMYVNYDNPAHFNPHRQYAYLRSTGKETLLVVANFANENVLVHVNIPAHAFETLGIPDNGEVVATELLTQTKMRKDFTAAKPFITAVPANGAVIWKIRHPKRSTAAPVASKSAKKSTKK